jgi:curved DNA-binding protein CbpA
MSDAERAAYRAFVREHHPDRGGDPDLFVAGLARLRAQAEENAARQNENRRYDAPIEVVRGLPFPVRVAVSVIRTVKRRNRTRVDRPPHSQES